MIELKKGKVLVVDDEVEVLTPLCDFLKKLGYEVMGFTSGKDALEAMNGQDFNLLLTDMVMPDMDGIELIRAAIEIDPILVGIVITGRGTIQTAVEAMKVGAFDYLLKPVEWKTLSPILSRAMKVRRLREAEEKYRSIVEDYQTEFICRFLFDGTLTFVNEAYCRYLNKKREELLGQNFINFILEKDRKEIKNLLASLDQKNFVTTLEYQVVSPSGEICWQRWTNRAIFNKHGHFIEFQAIGRDITDRKIVEEKLKSSYNQLKAITARLAEVEEIEKQKLARELHDQVGQDLTALCINLNIIRSHIPENADKSLLSRLDDSLTLVEQTAERIRDVMSNLRPSVMDDYGLMAVIRWYGEQFSKRTGLELIIKGEDLVPRLPQNKELTLFRIVQEALTNVAKHAGANRVTIQMREMNGLVQLIISDDGRGFDLSNNKEDKRSWGLLTMQERAQFIGGNVYIESEIGKGTNVVVEVPRH
jgi:PAS domain S-box-containing protein